jgi:NADPH:quinone reductase-like Zn-dependent oxidoreductase
MSVTPVMSQLERYSVICLNERNNEWRRVAMRVFLAGATGAIGRRLVPQLVARGHQVVATTRSPAKADSLRALGAEAVVVDGLYGLEAGGAAEPTRTGATRPAA